MKILNLWPFFLVFLILSGCASQVEQRGASVDPDKIAKIQIGTSSITDVTSILGTPTASSNFGDLTWYYVMQEMETWAFLKPEITKQNILVIRYDKSGIVQAIDQKDLHDAQFAESVKKTTPSAESQLTIFQQLLGNIGRFNGQESTK